MGRVREASVVAIIFALGALAIVAIADALVSSDPFQQTAAAVVVKEKDIGLEESVDDVGVKFPIKSTEDIVGQKGNWLELWADVKVCATGEIATVPDGQPAQTAWGVKPTLDTDRMRHKLWVRSPAAHHGRVFVEWRLQFAGEGQVPIQWWENGPYAVDGKGKLTRIKEKKCAFFPAEREA